MENYVHLDRQFSPIPKSEDEAESDEYLSVWSHSKPISWNEMEGEFRCVILAEAGAGKTEELRQRASFLVDQKRTAFFIRIEDIESDFYKAFEVGDEAHFQSWLESTEEAWFFLDSVDEARLDNPRKFEKALRQFASVIKRSAHRAHIYITSRPYAWRPRDDRKLMDEILFYPDQQELEGGEEAKNIKEKSALMIYVMRPLDQDMIRRFCIARAANDIERLLQEIQRANLLVLAERPFDLEGILLKWGEDNELGGRLELLRHNIQKRLRDDHDIDREQRQPLNIEKARNGARRLAAAVLLTGKPGLNLPDGGPVKHGIEAQTVLADWGSLKDVYALLERGIFNDVIYNAVRFRHRDVLELLVAEWFDELLKAGNNRHDIENLFFREKYGEKIVTPRLRPVLPWLILFDDEIRHKALEIHPEISVEGGDPSQLPLSVRKRVLREIVQRIVANEDDRSARDNSAIARIASSDLSKDVQQLIKRFVDNDDAIFFLGRLVWQGEMTSCTTSFVDIAIDGARGIYARIASARAVMTCGLTEQKQNLWCKLNESDLLIPRELLVELVQEAEPDSYNVAQLVISLGKLPPYDRYKGTGLTRSLHEMVDRLSVCDDQQIITRLLDGFFGYLNTSPYVERKECHVSEEYAWLLSPATHVVEKLIEIRSELVFEETAVSIMLMVPALRFWRDTDLSEHKYDLQMLVSGWPELNDALYWASIERARAAKEKLSEPMIDDWSVSWLGHFWSFDVKSLTRLISYMDSRSQQDDRQVALSTAFRVYAQADRPAYILNNLQHAVADDPILQNQLNNLLNPAVSETSRRFEKEESERKLKWDERKERENQARENWIAELRANPDRIGDIQYLKQDKVTGDQHWLMRELQDNNSLTKRSSYGNWQALITDFGEPVARSYRDAAINSWRQYQPTLQSEGGPRDNSTPYSLIFAMAGLEIEAMETAEFPCNLDAVEVRHALRYITWELNGFPNWFERIHHAFPSLVKEAVVKELLWELDNTQQDKPLHYILSNLVYNAPWLHQSIAPVLLEWMENNPTRVNINRYYYLSILINGGISTTRLSLLASQQIAQKSNDSDSVPGWYALRVDCEPITGVPEVEQWLSSLNDEAATRAAQIFITTLMGTNRNSSYPTIGNFHTVKHLKTLYILMHCYIRAKEDINRSGGGVYSPELRDDAQDARSRLLNLLSEIPGKESYIAIKQLIDEHPAPDYRSWMVKQSFKCAEEDGDLEPWSAEQVREYEKTQILIPETHRQLYELTVGRLHNLKNWLECGNDSPFQTWQRAENETEMRILITGWLNQQHHNRYITAQEPELANSQRMDIWLQNTNVKSPVPIELKLLDKKWSGPKLCERLRNQLAGDYLREEHAGCGVMLLVWKGTLPAKRWTISDRRVELSELANALKIYWQEIADEFPGVEEIDVIVIDLAMRARICNS